MPKTNRKDLIYPELSYKFIGCAFEAHDEVGGGYHEKVYQRALAKALEIAGLKFRHQVYYPVSYQGAVGS